MAVRTALLSVIKRFIENDYETAARIMERVNESEAVDVLKALPSTISAKVVSALQPGLIASLLIQLPPDVIDKIIEDLDPQKISDIILSLPDELRKTLLDKTPEKSKKQIQELLTFPEDSAGRLMTRDYVAFRLDTKVKDAISKIRAIAHKKDPSSYTFVVDSEHRLVGVLSMYDLIQASRERVV